VCPGIGTTLVNSSNADYARAIRDRQSITSHIHLLNGVAVAWKCKKQNISTLHSTGSEITSLTSGVKKTLHLRDFVSSLGYPIDTGIPRLEDSQGTIRSINPSCIHENTRHLAAKITWLNELYAAGIITPLYTKTMLQLADITTKPLCGKHLQAMISFLIGVRYYPLPQNKALPIPLPAVLSNVKRLPSSRPTDSSSTLPSTSA
jgi:hypothetical protein